MMTIPSVLARTRLRAILPVRPDGARMLARHPHVTRSAHVLSRNVIAGSVARVHFGTGFFAADTVEPFVAGRRAVFALPATRAHADARFGIARAVVLAVAVQVAVGAVFARWAVRFAADACENTV